jgi:hypothetical protein
VAGVITTVVGDKMYYDGTVFHLMSNRAFLALPLAASLLLPFFLSFSFPISSFSMSISCSYVNFLAAVKW